VATGTTSPVPNIQTLENHGITWINIDRPSLAEMQFLQERFPFHPLELEDCLSRVQLPKLDESPQYIFLVLHFPRFDPQTRATHASQVSIFVGPDYVVTVHQGDLRPLVKLFHDCQNSEEVRSRVLGPTAGHLLYRVLDGLVDYCFPILNNLISNVEKIEDRVLDERSRDVIRELSYQRREVISFRRIIHPQTDVLEALEQRPIPFLKARLDVYFSDLADHMRRIWNELEELKEVMESLQDSHQVIATYRTSEVMRMLTIIATIMLPLTVVTGLYGMNVRLPLENDNVAFLVILSIMGIIGGGMLIYFRVRGWV
jgi:magnesium transporter